MLLYVIIFHLQMQCTFCFPLFTLSSTSILIHLNRCFPAKRQTGHMVVLSCFKWKKVNFACFPSPTMSGSSEHGDDICLLLGVRIFPTSYRRNILIETGVFKFYLYFQHPVPSFFPEMCSF